MPVRIQLLGAGSLTAVVETVGSGQHIKQLGFAECVKYNSGNL